jgi:large subunit ribosomal protein L21
MAETKTIKKTTKKASSKAPVKTEEAPKKADKPKVSKEKTPAESDGSFAIIETGGKQYRVFVGEIIKIEKIKGDLKENDGVVFDKVLLVDNGKDATDIGTPYISGAKVSGTVVEIGRNKKVIVLKYKQKSRYLKKNGHRQPFFKVKIDKIA